MTEMTSNSGPRSPRKQVSRGSRWLSRRNGRALLALTIGVAMTATSAPASDPRVAFAPGSISRVSLGERGGQLNGPSGAFGNPHQLNDFAPALSADGSAVAFSSRARNTVRHLDQAETNIYVRERGGPHGPTTVRVSVGPREPLTCRAREPNAGSFWPALSADARFVAYVSQATTLDSADPVPADNNLMDVFVYDRDADASGLYDDICAPGGTSTARVSVRTDGGLSTSRMGHSFAPAISDDGSQVAFISWSANLTDNHNTTCGPTDTPEACANVFVRNRDVAGTGLYDQPGNVATVLVSKASDGTPADGPSGGKPPLWPSWSPAMSPDGRFIAFHSYATNLTSDNVDGSVPSIYIHDRDANETGIFDEPGGVETVRIPTPRPLGASPTSAVPGRIYRAVYPSISADGRYVAYQAMASIPSTIGLLYQGDLFLDIESRVFVYDRETGDQIEVNVPPLVGVQAEVRNYAPTISGDGRFVGFTAGVQTMWPYNVPGTLPPPAPPMLSDFVETNVERNFRLEVYIHDRDTNESGTFDEPEPWRTSTRRVSFASSPLPGYPANGDSFGGRVSRDGSVVGFISFASNLVSGDTNNQPDAFLWQHGFGLCPGVRCIY